LSFTTCLALAKANFPLGTSSVIVEPAPTVAPFAILTGAINRESDPTKTSSSIMVLFLFAPS
jgi:hypothetical protein